MLHHVYVANVFVVVQRCIYHHLVSFVLLMSLF